MLGDVLDSGMLFDKVFNLMYFNDLNLVVEYAVNNRLLIKDVGEERFKELFYMNFSEFDKFRNNLSDLKVRLNNLNNFNSIEIVLIE